MNKYTANTIEDRLAASYKFQPQGEPTKDRIRLLNDRRRAITGHKEVFLDTDGDDEGVL